MQVKPTRGAPSVRGPSSTSNHTHLCVAPIICGDPVVDYASLSSSQCGGTWHAIVAMYGLVDAVASRVGDVASVPLRAASHDAPAEPPGARV